MKKRYATFYQAAYLSELFKLGLYISILITKLYSS